jgi:GTP-binding protein
LSPADGSDPEENYKILENEVAKYSEGIAEKDRWLVFSKLDIMPEDQVDEIVDRVVKSANYKGPVFKISAHAHKGTEALCNAIQGYILEKNALEQDDEDWDVMAEKIREEIHDFSSNQRDIRRARRQEAKNAAMGDSDSSNDDDDDGVVVHYEP